MECEQLKCEPLCVQLQHCAFTKCCCCLGRSVRHSVHLTLMVIKCFDKEPPHRMLWKLLKYKYCMLLEFSAKILHANIYWGGNVRKEKIVVQHPKCIFLKVFVGFVALRVFQLKDCAPDLHFSVHSSSLYSFSLLYQISCDTSLESLGSQLWFGTAL